MGEIKLTINLALENEKPIIIQCNDSTATAEEVCIKVCKQLNIGTLARHLFGLRINGTALFLMPNAKVYNKISSYDLRIRYKVAHIGNLNKLDSNAYNYYFHQVRIDVLENKIPNLFNDENRSELLGLGITDMFRIIVEKGISREVVEREYKKYIPKPLLKKHNFFLKKPIHDNLVQLERKSHNQIREANYIKSQYLHQLNLIAPEYLTETFSAESDIDGSFWTIIVKVSPPHVHDPAIKYYIKRTKGCEEWTVICTIEELGFISIGRNGAIEISRLNGIPFYLKFNSTTVMWSFISLLDGYYRLTCKWTFNLCQELETPSFRKLHFMKCHGPVGGEFSYAKLEAKTGNRRGCFIIRESETAYNTYYIDVCIKNGSKPISCKLEMIKDDEYIFNNDVISYKSIHHVLQMYSDSEESIYLKECIPPSEYDISPLLLCRSDTLIGDALTDSSTFPDLIPKSPVCINYKDLQVYKGHRKDGFRNLTHVYRGMWKVARGKKVEVALKMLKQDQEKHMKFYLNLIGQWAFLKSNAIIRLFGIAFSANDISLVSEYFKLGPLDQYLRDNQGIIKNVDLIEATSNLASALWHLKENDIIHGRIRCRKLMVYNHEENSFNVKLTDGGIHTSYDVSNLHWIPIEHYSNADSRSTAADVWAFATTVFEIFTYGRKLPETDYKQTVRWYLSDKRLPQPQNCPDEIYTLMLECWNADPHRRKQPQEISRDVNQLLYQVYNSRKKHSYDVARTRRTSNHSISSSLTDSTEVIGLINQRDDESSSYTESNISDSSSHQWLMKSQNLLNFDGDLGDSTDLSQIFTNITYGTTSTSLDSLNSMQSIFELDDSNVVVLIGRIGQGFYGDVFKGSLEDSSDTGSESRTVAVKKLKSFAAGACVEDFEREISIMKTLKHKNIVEILGVLREPDLQLVMEFVPHGSLQSYLKINKENLHTKQLLKYASDIALGMDYLGKKNIVHRDLATRNILVLDENHVKISDFGLAQFMGTNNYYILKSPNKELPIKWYAPESLVEGKFSVKSDVWSYGVTLFEMFNYGEDPPTLGSVDEFPEGQEQHILLQAIQNGERYPCPEQCPQSFYVSVIRMCWEADPHQRPTFHDLINEIHLLTQRY